MMPTVEDWRSFLVRTLGGLELPAMDGVEDPELIVLSRGAFFFLFERGGGTAESLRTPEDSERTLWCFSLVLVFDPAVRFFFEGVVGELTVDELEEFGSDTDPGAREREAMAEVGEAVGLES